MDSRCGSVSVKKANIPMLATLLGAPVQPVSRDNVRRASGYADKLQAGIRGCMVGDDPGLRLPGGRMSGSDGDGKSV